MKALQQSISGWSLRTPSVRPSFGYGQIVPYSERKRLRFKRAQQSACFAFLLEMSLIVLLRALWVHWCRLSRVRVQYVFFAQNKQYGDAGESGKRCFCF